MNSLPIIETRGLTRRFGDVTAVDAVDLSISTGEIFGLLGPNGAGTTTMIKMLTTLLPPTTGTALVAGFDIERESARVRGAIAYVPQLVSADGGLTAYSTQGGIAGKSLYIRYVAMSGPATDLDFCAASQSGSLTTFRALDLGITNAGGKVTLKR